jgi:uncharacterized protein (DUF58 family)
MGPAPPVSIPTPPPDGPRRPPGAPLHAGQPGTDRPPGFRDLGRALLALARREETDYYDDTPRIRSVVFAMLGRLYAERFTPGGRWFMAATFLFAFYGAASLDIQAYVLFCYSIALWLAASTASHLLLPAVSLTVRHGGRVCAGQVLPVDVELTGIPGRLPPGVPLSVLPHRAPRAVTEEPPGGATLAAPARGVTARTRLGLRCARRGVYRLDGFRVQTAFPLGLLYGVRVLARPEALVVYPGFSPLARMEIGTARRYQPGGVALASTVGEAFEYLGNREYRYGDPVRDIDWRATARLNQPIVREWREEYFMRVAVVLDTHVPAGTRKASEQARAAFEGAISVAAAVSDYMARHDYLLDLFAAGPNLYHLTAGRSLAYLDQILDILAAVRASRTPPFQVLEPELCEHLSRLTSVVCVFTEWDARRRDFARNLEQGGTAVKVVVVREGEPALSPESERFAGGPVSVLTPAQVAAGLEEL